MGYRASCSHGSAQAAIAHTKDCLRKLLTEAQDATKGLNEEQAHDGVYEIMELSLPGK